MCYMFSTFVARNIYLIYRNFDSGVDKKNVGYFKRSTNKGISPRNMKKKKTHS